MLLKTKKWWSFLFRTPYRKQRKLTDLFVPSLAIVGVILAVLLCCAEQVAAEDNTTNATIAITTDDVDVFNDYGDVDGIDNGNSNGKSNASANATAVPGENGAIVERPTASVVADAILFPWFVQFLGCLAMFVLTRINLPVPFASVMFILGALMGYGAVRSPELADPNNDSVVRHYLIDSITQWINIDSDTLLLIFLPGLIFKDAVDIPINLFVVAAFQIWILAFPMVLVGTALTGLAGKYCLPYESQDPESFGWWAWMVLGAILASTDPIAVASVLKTAGASPRLVMHISGESLMNDGSSYVFFQIAIQLWYAHVGLPVQEDIGTWGAALTYFVRMSLGGTVVGTIFGFGLLGVLWELDRRMEREFDIIQVVFGLTTAYLCYFVCDQIITMSGVISTVACGLVVNQFGRGLIHDKDMMSSYLALADFLLNTLLFALGGVIWAAISFSTQNSSAVGPMDWAYLMVFYVLCMIIRFVQVGIFYPVLSRIGLKSNWKEGVFLAYGGLHGSVGVALGLSLVRYVIQQTEDERIRDAATKLQFLGGGATLLTLTINGTSAGTVLKILGLVKPPVSAEHVKHVFEGSAKDFVYNEMSKLLREKRFQNVTFDVLKEHVPFVITKPPSSHVGGPEARGSHQEETIQKFHRRLVGEGKQYISLLNATKRAVESYFVDPTESEEYKTELLVEMRQIFLELLREAYKVEEEVGELDRKQHNGYLFEVLIQSVDLAINEVMYDNKPIEDWKHTEIFFRWDTKKAERSSSLRSSSIGSKIQRRASRKFSRGHAAANLDVKSSASQSSFASSLMSFVSFDGTENSTQKKTNVGMKRIRLNVLRALAFIHAHKMAEAKLRLYVNRFDDDLDESMFARHKVTDSALEIVLAESHDQLCCAQEMLEKEVSDEDLDIIFSYYCAKILVRRLLKFTEEKSKEGMIGKQETRAYTQRMKDCVHQIDTDTIRELMEARVNEDIRDGNRRGPSTILRSIVEDSDDTAAAFDKNTDRARFSPSPRATTNAVTTPRFQVDPANADTIGASNTTSETKTTTTSLANLFKIQSEPRVTSMPEVEEDEDEHRENKNDEERRDTDGKSSSLSSSSPDGNQTDGYASA